MTFLVLSTREVVAYPRTIGHGYTSCSTCHFNPYGYGPLTDYGRGLAATVMSARPPFTKANDEQLAESSGFLGNPDRLPHWLRLSGSFRGMLYINNITSTSSRKRFIPMQLEGSAVILPSQKLTLVGTFGFAPVPASTSTTAAATLPTLISREHYARFQLNKKFNLVAGFMDTAFGTRVPDHVAVHRKYTGLAQNDQTHGVLLHWMPRPWEIGLHGFLGNLLQSADLRQKGVSLLVERSLGPEWVVGFSGLFSRNSYRGRQLLAIHSRSGHGIGSSFLAEIGLIRTEPSGAATWSEYIWLQPGLELNRGLQLIMTLEHYMPIAFGGGEQLFRVSPGIHWAPMQRMEFRVEIQTTRYFGQGVVNSDIFNFLGQVHLWL